MKNQKTKHFLIVFLPHFLLFTFALIQFRFVSGGDIGFIVVWLFSYLIYFLIWFFIILFKISDLSSKKRTFLYLFILLIVEFGLFKVVG
jgi:hypothetical protein